MNEKIRQVLVIISTAAVIFVNYLATTSQIGGVTPSYISEKYPTYITPAGYAFSIWGLIYLGVIAFSIYQALPSNTEKFSKMRSYYILSCAANIAWIYLWHYEFIFASLFAMLILLSSLVLINLSLKDNDSKNELIFAKTPFSIYFGWVSIATVLNVAILLISLGIKTNDFTSKIIASLLVIIVTLVGIFIRLKLQIIFYSLTLTWAITAIAVEQSGKTAIVLTCGIAVVTLLIVSITPLLKLDEVR